MSETITIRLIEHGETTVNVDRVEYETAKADGELDQYLDAWASDIDTNTVVVEPDDTLIDPYSDAPPRTSLLGRNVTAAVAAIVERAMDDHTDADNECSDDLMHEHIARVLVDAVRQERLIIMPAADAAQIIVAAVEAAQKEMTT